jgi:hypothetical protein
MVLDAQNRMVPYASLSVTDKKKYITHGKGRIVDGVILSDPIPLVALQYHFGGPFMNEFKIHRTRVRIEPGADGHAKGMVAGYLELEDIGPNEKTGQYNAEMVGYDCPSFMQARAHWADGDKDPTTGVCKSISSAWEMNLVSAFIIHPEPAEKTAAVTGAAPQTAQSK